jgi:indolepyruvate ferredoxin oxidoreductase
VDPAKVAAAATPAKARPDSLRLSESLDETIARRVKFLTAYQDAAYAARYSSLVAKVRDAEGRVMPGVSELAEAIARYYFKVLAIKDEYEVARLYAESDFEKQIAAQFEGSYKLTFNLAPPIFNKADPATGVPVKSTYGPWMMKAFRTLAKMRKYRGTALDIFGKTDERKRERALIVEYEGLVAEILDRLSPQNHATAVELASIPEHIRGYGHVREAHLKTAKTREAALLAAFRAPAAAPKPQVVKVVV